MKLLLINKAYNKLKKYMQKELKIEVFHPEHGLIDYKKTPDQVKISKYLDKSFILHATRQRGISTLIMHSMLNSIVNEGASIFYISPTRRMGHHTVDILEGMFSMMPTHVKARFDFTSERIVDRNDSTNFIEFHSGENIEEGLRVNENNIRVVVENIEHTPRGRMTTMEMLERAILRLKALGHVTLQFFDSGEGTLGEVAGQIYLNHIYKLDDFDFINVNIFGVDVTTSKEFNKMLAKVEVGYPQMVMYKGLNQTLEPMWYKIFNIL
jgi:hypothetical protein